MMTRTLKFPSSSNWRPPGSFLLLLGGILINCIISPTVSLPFKEGKTVDGGVITLPSHFKVDDPESTIGYDANFGRRIPQNPPSIQQQQNFHQIRTYKDDFIQPSTLEEIKSSRVRKRTFSTSVISERTIQIKDDDLVNTNGLKRDSGAKHFNNNNPSSTTQRTAITTSPFGSSRAVIRFVSTVPPIPFGSRSTTNNNRGKSPAAGLISAVNPTNNPAEDPRKVTVRTVLRRPPIRIQSTRTGGSESGNDSKSGSGLGGAGATTLRSETPWTPINSTVATQRRTRVKIKDSLLARVQGRLRARSTTSAPSLIDRTPSALTLTERAPSALILTERPLSDPVTTIAPSTETVTDSSTSTVKDENLVQTTFKLPPPSTEILFERSTDPPSTVEEDVFTETSVSMSIGQSEAHQIVMTTLKDETEDDEDTTQTTFESVSKTSTPNTPTVPKPVEGILGSSLERPDGLQKELLAAIRRKISKSKENRTKETSQQSPINLTSVEDIEVSPASNAVGSTQQPPFFRPISFPNSQNGGSRTNGGGPRVKIFLRVPGDEKSGSLPGVKIQNYNSHIQGKLARLNAAITEGLRNDQLKRENASQITAKPRIGAYTSSTSSTTTTTTTTTTTSTTSTTSTTARPITTETVTDERLVVPIAEKTHTYLDILRERKKVKGSPTIITTTSSTTTTTTSTATTTTTVTSTTSKIVTKEPKDHPTSHLRPKQPLESSKVPSTTQKADVKVVHPSYGDFEESVLVQEDHVGSDEEKDRIVRNNNADAQVPDDSTDSVIHDITGTTVYVVGVICIIPAAGLVAWVVRYVVKKRGLANSENGSETGLNCPISDDDMIQVNQAKYANETSVAPVNKRKSVCLEDESIEDPLFAAQESIKTTLATSVWQISRQNLRFLTVLGEGNFGKVWKAEAENICGYDGTVLVAVKTTKDKAPDKEKSDLLQEMQIMQKIGHHPNVVTLLGVSIDKEPYLLVMEYVMYGKLLTHLREQRSKQTSLFHFTEEDLQQPSEDSSITAKDLTKYAYGVAKGMEYITSKQIIHRDLAARNILLDHTRCCKISDFGLSRNLGDTGSEMYEQKTKGALPIRWMAPESLYFSVFTPKSDVWSFGILMWEIVTLGSTPYPGMGAREVMRRVRDGYRLERPSHCHPDLYKIISKCWAGDMNKRPDFSELRLELAKLLENQHGYIDLHNIPENKYYSMTQTSDEDEKL